MEDMIWRRLSRDSIEDLKQERADLNKKKNAATSEKVSTKP